MTQIEYQRKAIMDDMNKSEIEKLIDLRLENAHRPDNRKKRKPKAAVKVHASNKHI